MWLHIMVEKSYLENPAPMDGPSRNPMEKAIPIIAYNINTTINTNTTHTVHWVPLITSSVTANSLAKSQEHLSAGNSGP